MEILYITLFIVIWLLIGSVSFILGISRDLRNNEYNEGYFDEDFWEMFWKFTALGFITVILFILLEISELNNKGFFNKLIYNICNIGVKKKNGNDK